MEMIKWIAGGVVALTIVVVFAAIVTRRTPPDFGPLIDIELERAVVVRSSESYGGTWLLGTAGNSDDRAIRWIAPVGNEAADDIVVQIDEAARAAGANVYTDSRDRHCAAFPLPDGHTVVTTWGTGPTDDTVTLIATRRHGDEDASSACSFTLVAPIEVID